MTAARRAPDVSFLFLALALLIGGTVNLPQMVEVGPVSGGGALSILLCGGAWLLWVARPTLRREHVPVLLPLIFFCVLAVGSMGWFVASTKGLQLLCVLAGFLGFTLLSAREVESDPRLAVRLHRVLDVATWFATATYAASLLNHGIGNEAFVLPRPFALFALIGIARQLSIWQRGDWRGFVGAAVITAVILLSVSRVALVAALILFPVAAVVRGDAKGLAFAGGTAILGGLVLAAALALSPLIYDRFFGYDSTMQIGGVWINGSGRTAMWALLWENAQRAPVLGHGLASSSLLMDHYFVGLGHPHNDFLRFFHDFGAVGLGFWIAFHGGAMVVLFRRARAAARANSPDHAFHLVPFLSLVAVALAMFTDNSVSYSFVMMPLGILFGCSLGRSAAAADAAAAPVAAAAAGTRRPVRRRRELATAS